MNGKNDREEQRVLDLLDVVEKQSDLSQRHLARHMGVALGLANSYLKRCIRKGLIKISQAPANRYLYYLTPKGFSEKSRLTAKYLAVSFEFYRQATRSWDKILETCDERGWRRVLLRGASDLAEIVLLKTLETDATVVGVLDEIDTRHLFFGRKIWRSIETADPFDCCILTDLQTPQSTYGR